MIPLHNRYAYSAITKRPTYTWPEGKRLAFWIGTNVELYAFQAGIGNDPAKIGEPQNQRNYAWRDYGNRVGFWNLMDLYDEFKLPASHLINTWLYDFAPEMFERIRGRGDDIIGHGRTNAERQKGLWEAESTTPPWASSRRAQRMLVPSSSRALISTSTATCLPQLRCFRAAVIW